MKKILSLFTLVFALTIAQAQTTATNFTATDCNSVSHTLFNDLDAGQIVVLVWVMPCPACLAGSDAAFDAMQSFATSHPGKVKYYLVDDMGDDNCAALNTWATNNGINTSMISIFQNASNEISEANFGGSGMPHVVVTGGTDHHIYYNQKNGATDDLAGITAAISSALNPTGLNEISNAIQFSVTPNPVQEKLSIQYEKAVVSMTITSVNGQMVKEEFFGKGRINPVIGLSGLANGVYHLVIRDTDGKTGTRKIVKE